MAPIVVELLDGSWLAFEDNGTDDAVERELEAWALVPDASQPDESRAGPVWEQALEAGPLLYMAFQGVVGNAAWAAFPAAAKYISALRSRRRTPVDAEGVVARIRALVAGMRGDAVAAEMVIRDIRREGDGTWRATVELPAREIASVRVSADGVATHFSVRSNRRSR